jgi:hypothetical protein
MGGPGSSRWGFHRRKRATEEGIFLDVRYLHRQGFLRPGQTVTLTWHRGSVKVGDLKYFAAEGRIILDYHFRYNGQPWEDILQEVRLTSTSCNYGGRRPWFLCRCGQRVGLLYAAGKYFLCRHCYNLTYASCNEDWLQRAERRRGKVLQKLGRYQPWRGFVPEKKRWMHWETYDRLCCRLTWTDLECLFGDKRGRTRIWDYLHS